MVTVILTIFLDVEAGGVEGSTSSGDSLLRGTPPVDNKLTWEVGTDLEQRSRRLLVRDQECTLYKMIIEHADMIPDRNRSINTNRNIKGDEGGNNDEEEWHCELDKEYSQNVLGLDDPLVRITGSSPRKSENIQETRIERGFEDYDFEDDDDSFELIESGTSTMKIGEGLIDRNDNSMYVHPAYAQVIKNRDRRRMTSSDDIIPKVGNKKVVIVRITTDTFVTEQQSTHGFGFGTDVKRFLAKFVRFKTRDITISDFLKKSILRTTWNYIFGRSCSRIFACLFLFSQSCCPHYNTLVSITRQFVLNHAQKNSFCTNRIANNRRSTIPTFHNRKADTEIIAI